MNPSQLQMFVDMNNNIIILPCKSWFNLAKFQQEALKWFKRRH